MSNLNNPGKFLKQAQQPGEKEDAKPTEVRACHDPIVLQHALKNKTVVKAHKRVVKVMLPAKGSKRHQRLEQERLVRVTCRMPVRLKYRA